jgi:hypothetical protein
MADLTAAMAEHSNHPLSQQEISPLTPIKTIIMTAAEKTHVTEQLTWWETFKLVLFFPSLALVFAFLFACFRYFGIFACLYAMCCKPHPQIRPRSRSRRARSEVMDTLTTVRMRYLLPTTVTSSN